MFAQLPNAVKQQVITYLSNDNFTAAKALHDQWLQQHKTSNQPPKSAVDKPPTKVKTKVLWGNDS